MRRGVSGGRGSTARSEGENAQRSIEQQDESDDEAEAETEPAKERCDRRTGDGQAIESARKYDMFE